MPSAESLKRAQQWLAHDPDPDTRSELQALIDAGSDEVDERFSGPLEFGTAGLRGLIGAGESRMNRAVVRRTTYGLARWLRDHHPERGVVIGYDGRRLSDVFAQDAAAVLGAEGIRVWLSDGVCPTPIVAFAVKELGAAAGVMVTASHNPPDYNGYKVYADNGAQMVPPADHAIARAIDEAPPADAIALGKDALARFDVNDRYVSALLAQHPRASGDRSLRIVHTSLHGVGDALVARVLAEAGFTSVLRVPEQAAPDGRFPTVAFPNPEEPGALDMALALARREDAPLVLANDPDVDRLAAAVRTPAGYRQLTGNELGVLLGHYLLARDPAGDRLVIATIVSSPWLGHIARTLGVRYAETLTGFKWIANKALEMGSRFVFGYEEALGYTVGTVVRDKDGIGAALALAVMAAELHARGETLLDELARIARHHGLFSSKQRSLAFTGAAGKAQMDARMAALRERPPASFADHPVVAITDCLRSTRTRDGRTEPIDLPASNVLVFDLAGGHRVVARPSGTEPKLKLYIDVREALAEGEPMARAEARAAERIARLEQAVLAML